MSHLDKLISQSGHLVHKLKAQDTTGRWAYYFVFVPQQKERQFLKAIEGDTTIDLEDFGHVIGSCYGTEPTEQLKIQLKERYGFDI